MNRLFKIFFPILISLYLFTINIKSQESLYQNDNITNFKMHSMKIRNSNQKQMKLKNKNDKSFERTDEFKSRQKEFEEFYKKLDASLQKYKLVEPDINVNEISKKIKAHLGNGFYLIVFNCDKPSHFDLNNYVVELDSNLANEIKRTDKCESKSGYNWFYGDSNSLTTYDYKTKSISSQVLPFGTLFTIFNKLSLCDEFLKIMKHPSSRYQTYYVKPSECAKSSGSNSYSSQSSPQSNKYQYNYQPSSYYSLSPSYNSYPASTKSSYASYSSPNYYPSKQNTYSNYNSHSDKNRYPVERPVASTTPWYTIPPGFHPIGYYPPICNA
jgi:hypothetical protein